MEPGIYLETKPVDVPGIKQMGYKHAYLVYRKADGTTEVLRGGVNGVTLVVETDKSLENSADHYKPGETPRHSKMLDIPQDRLDQDWDTMKKTHKEVGEMGFQYGQGATSLNEYQISNSVTRAALDSIDYDYEKALPEGVTKKELLGITDDMELARDRKENPIKYWADNPTDAEIGGWPGEGKSNQPDTPDSGDEASDGDNTDAPSRTPEVQGFLDDLQKPDDPVSEILLKEPRDWTEGEVKQVHGSDAYQSSSHARQPEATGKVLAWNDHYYGTEPVEADATGRTIAPTHKTPPPQKPVPAMSKDGRPVVDGVLGAGSKIADMAGKRGLSTAIRGAQVGLNLLDTFKDGAGVKTGLLKTDGQFGPRTKQSFKMSIAGEGQPKVENAVALGTFQNLLASKHREPNAKLAEIAHDSFSNLFEKNSAFKPTDKTAKPWGLALQDTINDAGQGSIGKGAFTPIVADGWLGPKTEDAFERVYRPSDLTEFMKKLGDNFGFF